MLVALEGLQAWRALIDFLTNANGLRRDSVQRTFDGIRSSAMSNMEKPRTLEGRMYARIEDSIFRRSANDEIVPLSLGHPVVVGAIEGKQFVIHKC